MPTTRKTPTVIVLTEEALVYLTLEIQNGFAAINARLDALESRLGPAPSRPAIRVSRELATAALQATITRPPAAHRRPVKRTAPEA